MVKLPAYSLDKAPYFPANFTVTRKVTLNFTDLCANNNKFYSIELQIADKYVRVYTTYGRLGAPNPAREVRVCTSELQANQVIDQIIKEKTKKGYVEVKLIKADVGSEVGKAKVEQDTVKVESLEKIGVKVIEENKSNLHVEVQSLMRSWFGSTAKFIESNLDTKKCPLGQLSLDQILKGKEILEEARRLIHLPTADRNQLNKLTNDYYTNIPHILPHRINADLLRLDSDRKIDVCFDILDVFSDAKNIQKVLSIKSGVDEQYKTLNADFSFIEKDSPLHKWLETMVHETRARNHGGLGKIKVHRTFKVNRNNEEKVFLQNAERIAKECGKLSPSDVYANLVRNRPDVPTDMKDLYNKANILPGWHGTRKANLVGITKNGLLIRPSGVVHAGSMYGDSIYTATQSSKSINYCDVLGAYWASGNNKIGYLLLMDCAYGNSLIAKGSNFYTAKNIKPHHSVWAKGGLSGVINDEIMLYNPTGENQQHVLRYIIEFETQVK